MLKEITARSEVETFSAGLRLGLQCRKGDVFALIGELGSGKTIFAKGLASGLGVSGDITSPTFTLMEIYIGAMPLYHFDLYRIVDKRELDNLFFEEYWEDDGVCVIEWADRAIDRLPDNTITIRFSYIDANTRRITIEHPHN